MPRRTLYAGDCETDPFKHGRVPEPFIWGLFDGTTFEHFMTVDDFVDRIKDEYCFIYFHNGGKFDFMFLIKFMSEGNIKIINGRITEMRIGNAVLRDSYAIIPTSLAAYQKTDIEYWKMEKVHRDDNMREITSYLQDDCRNLFELVYAFRSHAGKGLTIAGNALSFAKRLGAPIHRTTKYFDSIFREYYYGGRCQALQCGVFEDVEIFDIKSAYPYAMIHEHPSGSMTLALDNLDGMSLEQIQQSFILIECFSDGAFPQRGKYSLNFPHEFGEYYVTGWEYIIAKKHGLIKRENIKQVLVLEDSISFQDYVDHWFEFKQNAENAGDKVERHIGKIMLNSLYGKLCQNPEKYKDFKVVASGTEPTDGWELGYEYEDKELHWRPSLYKFIDKYGEEWKEKPKFYNVATGASITGFCRAMLLDAIATVGFENAIYCDTDSVIAKRPYGTNLLVGGNLGQWGSEGIASRAYVGGKKLYACELIDGTEKIASKGARLSLSDIKRVVAGEVVHWFNDAPTFAVDGSANFIHRRITATKAA